MYDSYYFELTMSFLVGIAITKTSSLFLTLFADKKQGSDSLPKNNEDSEVLPMHPKTIKTNNELFENLEETGDKLDDVSLKTLTTYIDKRVSKILRKNREL